MKPKRNKILNIIAKLLKKNHYGSDVIRAPSRQGFFHLKIQAKFRSQWSIKLNEKRLSTNNSAASGNGPAY